MITVNFYGLDETGEDVSKGSIRFDGEAYETDTPELAEIVNEPVYAPAAPGERPRKVTADDPPAFLAGLRYKYRSAYFRADAPVEEGEGIEKSADFDEAKHPRADDGKFGRGSGSKKPASESSRESESSSSAALVPAPEDDPDFGRPSRPENRHDHKPPALDWKAPPPPQGKKGGGKPVRGTGAESQTKLGDHAEAMAEELGLRSILPPGRRSNKPGENKKKGSTLDREFDHSGHAFEVKMCKVTATEYRAKPKPKEIKDKLRYARKNKLKPATMICVYDPEAKEAHYYWKAGIVTSSLKMDGSDGWNYAGSTSWGES